MTNIPLTRGPDEETTSFSIRAIRHETWQQAHADMCAHAADCSAHTSPYAQAKP